MVTQTKLPTSIFPDYPRERPIIDKEGNLTFFWDLALGSLFQALQANFKNEGILFPPLNATQIADIQAIYTPLIGAPLPAIIPDISGQTIFDSTNRVPKIFIITYDGSTPPNVLTAAWKTFTVT
jgi:hypothetical protein